MTAAAWDRFARASEQAAAGLRGMAATLAKYSGLVRVGPRLHYVDPVQAQRRGIADRVEALTVFVNPYGRTPFRRIAAVLPTVQADALRISPEAVDRLLYWPLDEPFTVECYAHPYRIENGEVVMVPRTFKIRARRALTVEGRRAIELRGGHVIDHGANAAEIVRDLQGTPVPALPEFLANVPDPKLHPFTIVVTA